MRGAVIACEELTAVASGITGTDGLMAEKCFVATSRLRQGTPKGYDPAVVAMVRHTTSKQGLPEKVEDPDALRAVIRLLRPSTLFRLRVDSGRSGSHATSAQHRDQLA